MSTERISSTYSGNIFQMERVCGLHFYLILLSWRSNEWFRNREYGAPTLDRTVDLLPFHRQHRPIWILIRLPESRYYWITFGVLVVFFSNLQLRPQ